MGHAECKINNLSEVGKSTHLLLHGQAMRVPPILNGELEAQVPARPSSTAAAVEKKGKADKSSGGGIIAAIDAVGAGQSHL